MRPILLAVTVFSTLSFAQTIYKWEDANGSHYADSSASVPKGARNVEIMRVEPEAAAPAPSQTVVVHNSNGRVWEDNNQLNESQWRDRFVSAYRKIQTLEASLAAADSNPMTVCPAPIVQNGVVIQQQSSVSCLMPNEYERHRARIAQQKVDLADARADLEQLERNASIQNVPREWRRGW